MISSILHFCRSKVTCAPCLVALREIMDTIHSIAIKRPFVFSLNYFGSICNKSLGVKWTLKSISVAS